ncbi:MAG: hypothetical protein NZ874_07060, partial [Fimbriimonadales bacterium]|nr:hypothetical protein [Fimbriimonadales bacterium]
MKARGQVSKLRGVPRTETPLAVPALPTLIGWQGIRLNTPPDWFLKGYSGNWREGVLQIGSPQSAEIDLKWSRVRRKTDLH